MSIYEKTPCLECPYVVKSKHNENWKKYVKKMQDNGFVKNGHKCHMKVKDKKFWEDPNKENICVGQLKKNIIMEVESIVTPRIVINIDKMGTNSLVGALCEELKNRDILKNVDVFKPTEIVFTIKETHQTLDVYKEVNKVRDLLKIPEEKIVVYFLS